ncbi:unnamed protein product [Prorocentrum cordatum]|uniref:CCR4-Not complex component Not N-terminal domain-containing protein n=1 Tax=Prorocentrum cordatum TaxID=2364126 RepID=A0ABN9SWN2_9DINO|nr:unnamed protein product [Polarella glacialis]
MFLPAGRLASFVGPPDQIYANLRASFVPTLLLPTLVGPSTLLLPALLVPTLLLLTFLLSTVLLPLVLPTFLVPTLLLPTLFFSTVLLAVLAFADLARVALEAHKASPRTGLRTFMDETVCMTEGFQLRMVGDMYSAAASLASYRAEARLTVSDKTCLVTSTVELGSMDMRGAALTVVSGGQRPQGRKIEAGYDACDLRPRCQECKVDDGIEEFASVWEQANNASGAQREKLGEDLKRSINKLQRLRAQVREWIQNGDMKSGGPKDKLEDARRRIENDMQRFKDFERELKTKAFSTCALSKSGDDLELEELEKIKYQDWLTSNIQVLSDQLDELEADLEVLGNKKSLSASDKSEQARLKTCQERHRWHVNKLEQVLRALDNNALDMSDLAVMRDFVELYVENHQDPDYQHDEGLYDCFDLAEYEEKQKQAPAMPRPPPRQRPRTRARQTSAAGTPAEGATTPGSAKGTPKKDAFKLWPSPPQLGETFLRCPGHLRGACCMQVTSCGTNTSIVIGGDLNDGLGMEAAPTTREEMLEETRNTTYPLDFAALNEAIDGAKDDMKLVARKLYRSGLRRAHALGSAPAEAWRMLLTRPPEVQDRAGAGTEKGEVFPRPDQRAMPDAAPAAGAAAAASTNDFEMAPAWAGKRALQVDRGATRAAKESRTKGKGSGRDKDNERLEEMAVMTAKLSLTVAKDVEDMKAVVYECWEPDADKPMAAISTQAGKQYNDDVQKLKEQHASDSNVDRAALGPPHLVVIAAVIKNIAEVVPPDDKAILGELWKKVVRLEDPEMLGTCVKHYQAKTNKQPKQSKEKVRLIFSFDLHVPDLRAVREVLIKEIKREGGQRKLGGAPRGPLHRGLTKLVYTKS